MIELLESKLKDPYVREAFRRVKRILLDLEQQIDDSAVSDTVINNFLAASVWKKVNSNVLASTTTTIDQLSVNDFTTVKYIVSVRDSVNNKTGTFDITIKNENGSLQDAVSGKLSGGISFGINAINDAGFMKLNITNNGLENLAVTTARLVL